MIAALLDKLGLDPARFAGRDDPERWPALHAELSAAFRSRPRDAWAALFEGSEACVAPVLDLEEAPRHRHDRARGAFLERDGVVQPAPAPRFSRAPSTPGAPRAEEPPEALLRGFGLTAEEVAALRQAGALGVTTTETWRKERLHGRHPERVSKCRGAKRSHLGPRIVP